MFELRSRADSRRPTRSSARRRSGHSPLAAHLHELSIVTGPHRPARRQALSPGLLRARDEVTAARAGLASANASALTAQTQHDTLKVNFEQKSTALADLRARNAIEVAKIEAQRDAYEQSLGASGLGEINADGMAANPKALAAVGFALSQRNDPYQWGAEGPDRYDCSGLMWAAYRSVGYTLPRVANDQYHNSPAVKASRAARGDLLVPGDMVFFSTDPYDWTKIHHVGMYIGSGQMVHAPSTGDVVRIATVHWSEFFGAVRIFPAVPAPTQTPSPSPTTSSPTPKPSTSSSTPPSAPPSTTPPSTTPPSTTPPSSPFSKPSGPTTSVVPTSSRASLVPSGQSSASNAAS
jgi:cell wall-associated NlpC family hydrolase